MNGMEKAFSNEVWGRRDERQGLEPSARPASSKAPTDEEMERDRMADEIDYLRGLVIRMRGGLQEIYALRGEDDLVARVCNPLIEVTRGF